AYVSGDDKYDQPFKVTYDDSLVFEYDYVKLYELISEQFYNTWTGLSCEVTKSYGWCNNLTGLSLKLFDVTHGTQHTLAYQNWKRYFRENYLGGGTGDGPIEWYTLLYDMSADINLHGEEHQFAYNWMGTIWNGLPMDQRLFERMYDGAMQRFFTPQGDGSAFMIGLPGMADDYPYATITALSASRELGDHERTAGLRSCAMQESQPTWVGDPTSFRVTNLLPGARYRLTVDGVSQGDAQPADGTLPLDTPVGTHTLVLQQL